MRRAPRFFYLCCLLFFVVLSSSGCLTTKAATAREPLVVPPAPPRVIAPEPEPPEEPVTGGDREPVPPLPRPSRPPSRETNSPRGEPKPPQQGAPTASEIESAAKPPASVPAGGAPAVATSPELRTIDTPDPARATRQIRDAIERAGRTLSQIDYGRLPKPSQLQYDMAKRFIEQSEEALKLKNFTAAQLMAEKAETIARELAGR